MRRSYTARYVYTYKALKGLVRCLGMLFVLVRRIYLYTLGVRYTSLRLVLRCLLLYIILAYLLMLVILLRV